MLYWPSFSILCNPLLPTVESFLLQYLRLENTEEGVSGYSPVYSLPEFNPQLFNWINGQGPRMAIAEAWFSGHLTIFLWIFIYAMDCCPAGRSKHIQVLALF